jgi:hypothetical protein
MTSFTDAAASPPIAPFRIHYVDAPRDFSGIPLAEKPGRPVVAALATISTLIALAIVVVVLALIASS